jgi:PAS domain S-box-containing protein
VNLEDPRLLLGILQGMPEALVLADVQGVIRFWNAGAERLFGYPASEAVGANLDLIVPERFRAAHDAGFERAVASGELRAATRVLRTRASHKRGSKLYVDFTFALLKDASGTVIGAYAIGRDATEAHLKAQGGQEPARQRNGPALVREGGAG